MKKVYTDVAVIGAGSASLIAGCMFNQEIATNAKLN